MPLTPGTRLGRYEVRSQLGSGGMGEVYVAHDPDLGRDVAIKVMHAESDASSDRSRRFAQEAKAASSLNHPNVAHIYEFGSHDDLHFIAMEIVEGTTLSARMQGGPMPITDVLSIGGQIAAGLAAAHKNGIVHRDIKPANVVVRPDGYVKVLDFGLAKLAQAQGQDAATLLLTSPGLIVGTLRYMSPEQLSGDTVAATADVFSLGVVLYEMISGKHAFDGTTPTEIASAILAKEPRPIEELRPDIPPKLASVLRKALAKKPSDRYPSAHEMGEQLHEISRQTTLESLAGDVTMRHLSRKFPISRRGVMICSVLALATIGLLATSAIRKRNRLNDAAASISKAEQLFTSRRFGEAFDAAQAASLILPNDPRLRELMTRSSQQISVDTKPAGADVFLQRMGATDRVKIGVTPLSTRVASVDYILTIEKSGYEPVSRSVSMTPFTAPGGLLLPVEPRDIKRTLLPKGVVPAGMVAVEGGPHRLSGWSRPSDRTVELADFFIDRHEVSNREFSEFVRSGGYVKAEFWKHPFIFENGPVERDKAMQRFLDSTGLAGPRGWSGGAPPAGKENDPVTDITWYEAEAYAAWKGRSLPTIYQWHRSSRELINRPGNTFPWGQAIPGMDVTDRSNFRGKGSMPVDSLPFGMSPWGALHMAGNVAEWLVNQKGSGYVATGGSWDEPVFAFGEMGAFPPWYSSSRLGFRCARTAQGATGDQGAFALKVIEVSPTYSPIGNEQFEEVRLRYDYPKEPVKSTLAERVETSEWTREKILFEVAGEQVPAYLYLPKGVKRPLQVVHFAPGGDVANGLRTLPASIESGAAAAIIRGGRAVFSVVLQGFTDRPNKIIDFPDSRSEDYVDIVVSNVTELRRGLDYLATRSDLDVKKTSFYGVSAGTWSGIVLTALESPRYRSLVFVGTGISAREVTNAVAGNRINFVPHITSPKLVIHGRYDEQTPWIKEGKPLYDLLPEPKRIVMFDGPHVPPLDIAIPAITQFFNETLGPIDH